MKIAIDVILLIIIVFAAWYGYKRGFVNALIELGVFVLCVVLACVISGAVSDNAIVALKPFVSGFVESKSATVVADNMNLGGYSLADVLESDHDIVGVYCEECFKAIGIHARRADDMAETAVALYDEGERTATEAVVDVASDTIAYICTGLLAFILLMILAEILLNLFKLSYRLPQKPELDELGGLGLGFFKGFIYCVFLCWFLSFFGIVIGKSTLNASLLGRFFLIFEFVTSAIV